jgi:hypothetical protein
VLLNAGRDLKLVYLFGDIEALLQQSADLGPVYPLVGHDPIHTTITLQQHPKEIVEIPGKTPPPVRFERADVAKSKAADNPLQNFTVLVAKFRVNVSNLSFAHLCLPDQGTFGHRDTVLFRQGADMQANARHVSLRGELFVDHAQDHSRREAVFQNSH